MSTVHVVVPDGIDDQDRPSGGNTYDRRICRGLEALGWSVHVHAVPGAWPCPDRAARAALAEVVAGLPDGSVVVLDGLVASSVPDVLVPAAARLRLVVLVHMPLGVGDERAEVRAAECAVLADAVAVVTTSGWTRSWLLDHYGLDPGLVQVAEPGVDDAALAPGTAEGGELLCVAAVTPTKGHDVLVAALAEVADLPWRCVCVGSLDRDARFVGRIQDLVQGSGLGDRVTFTGARTGVDLDAAYAGADLLVLASRAETYGMVVTEALARGLPSIATYVGGVPEALGRGRGDRPGLLVPADDPAALAAALRGWLEDPALRRRLRAAAHERRASLSGWPATSDRFDRALAGVAT